jgi:hypothetical protein
VNGIGAVPGIHGEVTVHECSQVTLSFAFISIFFGEEDISVTLARFTLVATNVWLNRVYFDLTPALLWNVGVRLFSEAETSVRAFCPFVLNLIVVFPHGQIIKLIDCFSSEWVLFGTIVKCTWAVALIG